MGNKQDFQVLTFDEVDYSMISVLAKKHDQCIENSIEVNSIFSLYFQWLEHRVSIININGTWEECYIDYDKNERVPTILKLVIPILAIKKYDLLNISLFRFEIFGSCFEFNIKKILHKEYSLKNIILYIKPPNKIKSLRNRKLPRFKILNNKNIRISLYSEDNESNYSVKLREINANSFVFHSDIPEILSFSSLELRLNNNSIKVDISYIKTNTYLAKISDCSEKNIGLFFDLYSMFAFTSLKNKKNVDYDLIEKLYHKKISEYFHSTELNTSDILKESKKCWDLISNDDSFSSFDYVTLDDSGSVVGSSSLARAFHYNKKNVWTLHQLMTTNNIRDLKRTKDIYTWRSDILTALDKDFLISAWYNSESRWLDRIYTKFYIMSDKKFDLKVVNTYEVNYESRNNHDNKKLFSDTASAKRLELTEKDVFAGVGPNRWNFGNILNNFVFLKNNFNQERVNKFIIRAKKEIPEVNKLYITTESKIEKDNFFIAPIDRLILFKKELLPIFRSSVEHSIAVTIRKKQKNGN